MKSIITLSFVALFSALLSGCKLDVPSFDAATVEVYEGGRLSFSGVLSESQIKQVRDWLAMRTSGWEQHVTSEAPRVLVTLRKDGASVSTMNLTPAGLRVGGLYRELSAEEHQMLHLLLTAFVHERKEANQALQPTRMLVTFRADARPAPSTRVADL